MKNKGLGQSLRHRKFYVLSPHFDDAILSMGMLMYDLKGVSDVTIVNCFTKANKGPYTLSGRQFLKGAGFDDAEKLYEEREEEDKRALDEVGAKSIDLGLTDGLFRLKDKKTFMGKFVPEANHLYPTYRWHLTAKINPLDNAGEKLEEALKKIIDPDAIVFAPRGIGNHVDHMIVSGAAEKLFNNLIYYVDFPYTLRPGGEIKDIGKYGSYEHEVDLAIKTAIVANYTSQVKGLFDQGIVPAHTEKFLFEK